MSEYTMPLCLESADLWNDEEDNLSATILDWETVWAESGPASPRQSLKHLTRRRSSGLLSLTRRRFTVYPTSSSLQKASTSTPPGKRTVRTVSTIISMKSESPNQSKYRAQQSDFLALLEAKTKTKIMAEVPLLLSQSRSPERGVQAVDVTLFLAYACIGASSREIARIVTNMSKNEGTGEQALTGEELAELARLCEEHGIRFRFEDPRMTWLDRMFGRVTGTLSARARTLIFRRMQYLEAVFRSLESNKTGSVALRRLQYGLAALGEPISLRDIVQLLIMSGECDLRNLESLDILLFMKVMGSYDSVRTTSLPPGKKDIKNGQSSGLSKDAHCIRKRALMTVDTSPSPVVRGILSARMSIYVARLFIRLDPQLTGIVSCCGLANATREASETSRQYDSYADEEECKLWEKFALAVAKSTLRDTDVLDFSDLVQFVAENVQTHHVHGVQVRRLNQQSKFKTRPENPQRSEFALLPTQGLPWEKILQRIPVGKREHSFKEAVSSIPDRQLLVTTRDGSNLLHYVAARDDSTACKLLMSRPCMRRLVCERNRAGLHPAALAFIERHDQCEAVLRSWMGFALDAKMHRKAGNQRKRGAKSGYSGLKAQLVLKFLRTV